MLIQFFILRFTILRFLKNYYYFFFSIYLSAKNFYFCIILTVFFEEYIDLFKLYKQLYNKKIF